MSRKLRTNISMMRELRKPSIPDRTLHSEREEQYRTQLRSNYDHHYRVREIKPLNLGQRVWIADRGEEAHVVKEAGKDRTRFRYQTEIITKTVKL